MRAPRSTAVAVALGIALGGLCTFAGGPRKVNADGYPVLWDTSNPVIYFVDPGPLGTLSNAAATEIVHEMFDTWESVDEAAIGYEFGGRFEQDITGDNYRTDAYPHETSGVNPVVFDHDGSILRNELGRGAEDDILGITSYELSTGDELFGASVLFNGRCFDGNSGPGSPCELTYDELRATILHEIGHFSGLDHTDLGRQFVGDGRPSNNAVLPTMYPVTSEDDSSLVSLHLDDRLALARLYPSPGFPAPGSTVQGRVYAADGSTPFDGANVVLRNLADPYALSATAVSGDVWPEGEDPPTGYFRLEGLPRGRYSLEVRPVASIFTGRSSVGHQNRTAGAPRLLEAPAEFLSVTESADCATDLPGDFRVLTLDDTDLTSGIDVTLNDINTLPDGLSGSANDTFATATSVDRTGEVLGDAIVVDDVDYYRIFVPQGWKLRVDVDAVDGGLASSLRPIVRLQDAAETILYDEGLAIQDPNVTEIADPATGLDDGTDPAFDYLAPTSGDLVVAIASADDVDFDGSASGTGPYYLRLTPRSPVRGVRVRAVGGGGLAEELSGEAFLIGAIPTHLGAAAASGDGTIVLRAFLPPDLGGDADQDGIPDSVDPCPQSGDTDADGICDVSDNCPTPNPMQRDGDADGLGDRCDGPSVVSVVPADRSFDVSRSVSATVVFSEPMNPSTLVVSDAVRLTDAGGVVPTDLTISTGDKTVTLDPMATLDPSTLCTIEVGGSVEDEDGVALGMPVASEFTTRAGTADVIETSEIGIAYQGHEQQAAETNERFGRSIAVRGDANADEIRDVLIGAPRAQSQKGRVKLLFGESGGVQHVPTHSLVFVGGQADERAGTSVAFVPDVNGDGIDELLIGAPGADPEASPGAAPGAVYLVFGHEDLHLVPGPVDLSTITDPQCDPCGVILAGGAPGDLAGQSVSYAGDFNGDDLPDIVVGAPGASPLARTGAGIAYVVHGGAALEQPGLIRLDDVGSSVPGVRFLGEHAGDEVGQAVCAWEDLEHDGADDILVGAPGADVRLADDSATLSDAGVVYALMGKGDHAGTVDLVDAALDPAAVPSIVFLGVEQNANLGYAVWGRGDVDGDGEHDILIGAPGMTYEGRIGAGAGFVVPSRKDDDDPIKGENEDLVNTGPDSQGTATGNSTNLRQLGVGEEFVADYDGFVVGGENAGDQAGFDIASAGDLDGDGTSEILVGAPGFDPFGRGPSETLDEAGRVYVVFGQRSRVPGAAELGEVGRSVSGLVIEGDVAYRRLGEAVAGVGDIDDSGSAELVLGGPGDETTPPDGGTVYITVPIVSGECRDLRIEIDSPARLEWAATPGATQYAVYRGELDDLALHGGVRTAGTCAIVPGVSEVGDVDGDGRPDFEDATDPAAGSGLWYLVAGASGYGTGPIGKDSAGRPRVNDEPSCP